MKFYVGPASSKFWFSFSTQVWGLTPTHFNDSLSGKESDSQSIVTLDVGISPLRVGTFNQYFQ